MTALAWSLLLVPLAPGTLALIALVLGKRGPAGAFAIAGPLPAAAVGFLSPLGTVEYPWLFLGARLGLDETDALFLSFTALVWLVAGVFAYAWLRGSDRHRFFVFFLLSMAGNLGALVAQDLPGFYACFALMSFAAYGLVIHSGSARAKHAAQVYIVLVLIGEAALLVAMLMAAGHVGSADFAGIRAGLARLPDMDLVIAFAVLGFGIKAGAPILHVWLPLAHPVAPAPASAVLSGTMIATGLVGWLRFLPVGELMMPAWGAAFIIVGFGAAFYGAFVGLDQREPKVLLAYSSVSQMGIMTVGVGANLLAPAMADALVLAVAFFALHHGLAKSALFLGAGLASTDIPGRRRTFLAWGLALPSLALAGAPLTSGTLAKSALLAGDVTLPEHWSRLLHVMLPLTSVATTLLMARFLALIVSERGEGARHNTRLAWGAWVAAVILAVTLPWALIPAGADQPTLQSSLAAAWPLAVALLLASGGLWIWRRAGRPAIPMVPAGDILAAFERSLAGARRALLFAVELVRVPRDSLRARAAQERHRAWIGVVSLGRMEGWLNRWQVALLLLLVLGAGLALLSAG